MKREECIVEAAEQFITRSEHGSGHSSEALAALFLDIFEDLGMKPPARDPYPGKVLFTWEPEGD